MKTKLTLLTFSFLFLITSDFGRAEEKNATFQSKYNDVTLAQKLKIAAKEIASRGKSALQKNQDRRDYFYSLEKSVEFSLKNPSPVVIEALVEFSAELAILDNSATVGRLLLPLYKKYPEQIKQSLNKLDKAKRSELLRQLKVRTREEAEGNG